MLVITHVKTDAKKPGYRGLIAVKARDEYGASKVYAVSDVIDMVKKGYVFLSGAPAHPRVEVVDGRYIRTDETDTTRDSLLSLPLI